MDYYLHGRNGATYRLISDSEQTVIERHYPPRLDRIVGWNGTRFDNPAQAIAWAEQDAKFEMGTPGTPLSHRRMVEF